MCWASAILNDLRQKTNSSLTGEDVSSRSTSRYTNRCPSVVRRVTSNVLSITGSTKDWNEERTCGSMCHTAAFTGPDRKKALERGNVINATLVSSVLRLKGKG